MFKAIAFLNESEFRLYIEPNTLSLGATKITWLNIAFSRIVDGVEVQTLTGANESTSAVMGAVSNAIRDKINLLDSEYEIDAVAMCAVESELKRLRTYRRIVGNPLYGLSRWSALSTDIPIQGGKAFVAFSPRLSPAKQRAILADLSTNGKLPS
jgi:hypothetical protein